MTLGGLIAFLRYTRYGLIIRAGVENRAMVTALGIDVKKAFTLVFAIGGVAARRSRACWPASISAPLTPSRAPRC